MTFDEYQSQMRRTYEAGRPACYGLGLTGEAGEVADIIKKWEYHKVPYTYDQMVKELGDVLWYLTAIAEENKIALDDIAVQNVEKLRKRYPGGFVTGGGNR